MPAEVQYQEQPEVVGQVIFPEEVLSSGQIQFQDEQSLPDTNSESPQKQESAEVVCQKKNFFKVTQGKSAQNSSVPQQIKNECRYITTVVISSLKKKEYYEKVLEFADGETEVAQETIVSFTQKKQSISGFQTLKDSLTINYSDDFLSTAVKNCFRKFMIWFLENRYLRYLLSKGKMDQSSKYISYKNNVMLKNLKNPTLWNSNKISTSNKKKISKV